MKMWDERRWIWEAKRLLKMEEDEALTCLSVNIIMEVSFNAVGLFRIPFVWGWLQVPFSPLFFIFGKIFSF
jgi:hypothetical protein